MARLGALLTMVSLVLLALRPARIANLGANAADFAGELRSAAHESRCSPANCGAIPVKTNALSHLGNFLFT
jgi:hypothetical protein